MVCYVISLRYLATAFPCSETEGYFLWSRRSYFQGLTASHGCCKMFLVDYLKFPWPSALGVPAPERFVTARVLTEDGKDGRFLDSLPMSFF